MSPSMRKLSHLFGMLAMAMTSGAALGGTITFTGDSALVAALGGPLATGVNQVAVGQTVTIPFSATVAGVESVTGSVILTGIAGGGSIRLADVVFTVLGATTTGANFGISVVQAFAYSGPNSLNANLSTDASSHLTAPGPPIQPGDVAAMASITTQVLIRPDSSGSGSGFVPSTNTNFAVPSDPLPLDENYAISPRFLNGVSKATSNPVTLEYSYSTSVSTFNSTTGAGSSTTLRNGSFGFVGAQAVPEPSSLIMMGAGLASAAAWTLRQGRRRRAG